MVGIFRPAVFKTRWVEILRRGTVAAAMPIVLLGLPVAAKAESPLDLCRKVGTDDTLRPVPGTLVPNAVQQFHLENMPAEQVRHSTYFRCADHRVLICTVGANLPCGKADTRRHLPEGDAWCASHPGTPDIPAYVTGHATIYDWRCEGATAKATGNGSAVDGRGFIAEYWKPLGPD